VPDDINSPVLAVGGVAAAATTGALIAMGSRAGAAGLPFVAIGALVLHRTVTSGSPGLMLVGLVLHIAAMFALCYAFVWVVERHIHRETVAALIVAAGQFILSGSVTWITGGGVASILPLGDRIVFALTLAASMVVGIRLAFPKGSNV
jgi:hypothetical protein